MPTFDLRDYVTVADRIAAFWERYPDGRIHTTLIEYAADHVVMRAEVYTDRADDRAVACDYAEEVRSERGVNSSSMVENCATSAIGRALADLGMTLSKQRASREEMAKVQRHEDAASPTATILTDRQERVIAEAHDMASQRQPYPAVVNHLRALYPAADPDQWTAIRRALADLKAEHYRTPQEEAR